MSSKVKVWHPSEIWEWYREEFRHKGGGNGFVSFPDYKTKINDLEKIVKTLHENESSTTLKSRCFQMAVDYFEKINK